MDSRKFSIFPRLYAPVCISKAPWMFHGALSCFGFYVLRKKARGRNSPGISLSKKHDKGLRDRVAGVW